MLIKCLELFKYKRFALNNVQYFKITPTQLYQLILGTNGSGKSSLLKELSPLPADKNDFSIGGYKKIYINHKNNSYELFSLFTDTHNIRYSFIKNDEELNPGGTVTVQRELVKQEFNITPAIHELFIGIERFHAMSPATRREWFTLLSDVNYDYAIDVFNRLKERSRDLTGALKLAKKRIVTETSKIVSSTEEAKLRDTIEQLHSELNILIAQNSVAIKTESEYESDWHHLEAELRRLTHRLFSIKLLKPDNIAYSISSLDDIDFAIMDIKNKISANEALLNKLFEENNKLVETESILVKSGQEGTKDLIVKLKQLTDKRNGLLEQRKLKLSVTEPDQTSLAIDTVYDVLSSVLLELPSNENRWYSNNQLSLFDEQLIKTKNALIQETNLLTVLVTKKTTLETHKANGTQSCPKCKHTWIIGYDDERYELLKKEIGKKEELLSILSNEIEKIEKDMAAIRTYGSLYRNFTQCVNTWPVLQPLWDYLITNNYVINSPKKALSEIDIFRYDLVLEIQALDCLREIKDINSLIKSTEEIGDANITDIKKQIEVGNIQIHDLTTQLNLLHTQLNNLTFYKKQIIESKEIESRLSKLIEDSSTLKTITVEAIRKDVISFCIRQHQSALATKQESLSAIVIQKEIVANLELQIDTLTTEEEAAKLLVKQLSPTDGLIAEGLLGFIRNFIHQMNSIIRKTWTYPLQIIDCGVSESGLADLDYRFPLMVGNKTNVVSDVKLGSSGMQEIIDIAFRVTAAKFLGLSDYVLYMDEPFSRFDKNHRVHANSMIKNIMETQSFTQLFMINHYSEEYGSFTNAESCVLDSNNIVVPKVYNKHVVLN